MKIVVIGPGALGCLLAASFFTRSGHETRLLDHDRERAASLTNRGITLEECGKAHHCRIPVFVDAKEIGAADLILLCVKSYAVSACLGQIRPLLSDHTLLLTFQNGIGHIAALRMLDSSVCWLLGVTSQGATLVSPGHVRSGGKGITHIGFEKFATPVCRGLAEKAAKALTQAGFETVVEHNIMEHVWAKLLVNVGVNALTAILGCPNGHLVESREARAELEAAVTEAAAVAEAKGIHITADPVAMTLEVCRATAANRSSMLQDVQRKRKTEIDAINGAVVNNAKAHGISTPVNEKLVSAIKRIEQSYL